MNPGSNDILLFKMDPRKGNFSLSFQVIQQELLNQKFSPNQKLFDMIKNIGGKQPTPDNPQPKLISQQE